MEPLLEALQKNSGTYLPSKDNKMLKTAETKMEEEDISF